MGSQGISCTVYVSALRRYTIPEEKERPSFLCLSGAWADYLISFTIWASRWNTTASPMPSLLPTLSTPTSNLSAALWKTFVCTSRW